MRDRAAIGVNARLTAARTRHHIGLIYDL